MQSHVGIEDSFFSLCCFPEFCFCVPLPSHCFWLKEGKILPSFPFASGGFPWEGKSKVFLSPLPQTPSWSAGNGIADSSGLLLLLTEPCLCSHCANFEKSKEMLLQCTGIPETGAFCLQQKNTKQQKEASVQEEEAEQQDRMEVGFGNETGFLLKSCLAPSCTVKNLAALEGEEPSLQIQLEFKRKTLEELKLERDVLEQERDDVGRALNTLLLGSTCGSGSCGSQISPDALSGTRRQAHCCAHLAQDGTRIS